MESPSYYRKRMRIAFYIAVTVSLFLILVGWWHVSGQGLGAPGERFTAIGRLFGLLAAWCIVLEIILMSRTPFIEQNFDLHDTVDLHRLIGYSLLIGISAHTVFLVVGYAIPIHANLFIQFIQFNTQYEDILWATVGTLVLFGASALSVRIVRSHIRYELWYVVHLTIYLAILLTFLHEVKTGGDFVGQFLFTAYWYMLYIFAFLVWLWYRVLRPFVLLARYRFKIQTVEKSANDTYSIIMTGRNIETFSFIPGQYATWRILAPGLWLEAHPFSISSQPGSAQLRFSIRTNGDYTKKLALLQPGAYVILDGPRGSFGPGRAEGTSNVTLIAGGIGVTPYIPMIDHLLRQQKNVTLLYSARTPSDFAFVKELMALEKRGLLVKLFLDSQGQRIEKSTLKQISHTNTTVYICGPDSMSKSLTNTLEQDGFPHQRIIIERFAF
jgi:predicted ferric reductase